MKSMTGYGKSTHIDENYEIQFEIKSVNHKSFDLKTINYRELLFLENEMKEMVFERIKRGKIDLRLTFRDKQIPVIEVDENRLKAFYQMLLRVKETLNIKEDIKLDTLIGEPDVIVVKKTDYDNEAFRKIFFSCLNEAIRNHQILAKKEGTALKTFFIESFSTIERCLNEVKETIPAHKEKLKENLINTVKHILNSDLNSDMEKRILLETGLYLERCDITEEIVRIESHLANIKSIMTKDVDEMGKSMNFILQEMQREANTISSKYNTSVTFQHVLLIKEEIEKCREQIQNVK